MFMLRAVNTAPHQEQLSEFDSIIRGALSCISGNKLPWLLQRVGLAFAQLLIMHRRHMLYLFLPLSLSLMAYLARMKRSLPCPNHC